MKEFSAPTTKKILWYLGIPHFLIGLLLAIYVIFYWIPDEWAQMKGATTFIGPPAHHYLVIPLLAILFLLLGWGVSTCKKWGWFLAVLFDLIWIISGWYWILDRAVTDHRLLLCVPLETRTIAKDALRNSHAMGLEFFTKLAFIYSLFHLGILIRDNTHWLIGWSDKRFQVLDHCPTPVLIWGLVGLVTGGVEFFDVFSPHCSHTFFGTVLYQNPAMLVNVILAVLSLIIGVGLIKVKLWAWSSLMVFNILWMVSFGLTIRFGQMAELVEFNKSLKVVMPYIQNPESNVRWALFSSAPISYLLETAYLLWLYKYFIPKKEPLEAQHD